MHGKQEFSLVWEGGKQTVDTGQGDQGSTPVIVYICIPIGDLVPQGPPLTQFREGSVEGNESWKMIRCY